MKYKIDTDIDYKQSTIAQALSSEVNHLVVELSRWIIDTREQSTKDALIKLGWTPPKEM